MHWLRMAVLVGLMALAGCGSNTTRPTVLPAGNAADREFFQAMGPQLQSELLLSAVAETRGESRFVRSLARQITRADQKRTETLVEVDYLLAQQGVPVRLRGHGSVDRLDSERQRLFEAARFDATFTDVMTAERRRTIRIAGLELRRGANRRLLEMARMLVRQRGPLSPSHA